MSRYSSGYSSSTYSSYRSPYLAETSNYSSYLPSSTSSSSNTYGSSTYQLPSYEPKFDSLISRKDGTARSRAGTSTKYDYLSSYTSKYDLPYIPSSYTSSTYATKKLDADDLTRSYFEKYYSKSVTSDEPDSNGLVSSVPRTNRAYSVYVDDENSSNLRSSLITDARNKRSSSVFTDTNTVSSYLGGGGDTTSTINTRRFNRAVSILDNNNDSDTKSDYTRYLDRDDTTSARSKFTSSYSTSNNNKPSYSLTNGNDDYLSKDDKPSKYDTSPTEAAATTNGVGSSYYSRYSSYKNNNNDDSSTFFRRDSVRAYGGRSIASRLDSIDNGDKDSQKDEGITTTSTYSKYRSYNGYTGDSSEDMDAGSNDVTGTNGLRNIGNTCFMNSVIQCLSNTRQLNEYLISDEYTRDINSSSPMKGSLIKAFATVIKNLWKGSGKVVDPSSFKGALQRFAPRFSGYNQEDSQEFLRYLLEGLHEDVNRVTTKPAPIHTEIDSSLSVSEQAMEAWKRYIRRDDSRLVDLFVGQLKSTLRCTICDYESVTFEPFWDLSLPIPSRTGEVSLNECFEAFTKEEVLDGEEMPTCERCKTRRKCIKFYSLYKLPKILVVHLKRFSPTERFRSKLSSTVSFPLSGFDLSKFSDSHGRSLYSCYAVSNHSGTLFSGHYTAYAKNQKSGQWYFYNDSRVSKCSSSSVISNEAYLLFFTLS